MGTLTPGQHELAQRIVTVLSDDERIVSVWMSGSLGRGEGDNWSDIDITCVVEEEDLAACVAEYSGKRNPVGETLILRALYGRIVTAVTPEWERYDLAFVTEQEFRLTDPSGVVALTTGAKGPTGARRGSRPLPPERLAAIFEEFLRVIGLMPVAVGRSEWLVGQEGFNLLRGMLVDLMVEANGKTADRGGVKRLNAFLTNDQRLALEGVSPPQANRESLMDACFALASLFLPLAKAMAAERSVAWPQALEDATRRNLKAELGRTF